MTNGFWTGRLSDAQGTGWSTLPEISALSRDTNAIDLSRFFPLLGQAEPLVQVRTADVPQGKGAVKITGNLVTFDATVAFADLAQGASEVVTLTTEYSENLVQTRSYTQDLTVTATTDGLLIEAENGRSGYGALTLPGTPATALVKGGASVGPISFSLGLTTEDFARSRYADLFEQKDQALAFLEEALAALPGAQAAFDALQDLRELMEAALGRLDDVSSADDALRLASEALASLETEFDRLGDMLSDAQFRESTLGQDLKEAQKVVDLIERVFDQTGVLEELEQTLFDAVKARNIGQSQIENAESKLDRAIEQLGLAEEAEEFTRLAKEAADAAESAARKLRDEAENALDKAEDALGDVAKKVADVVPGLSKQDVLDAIGAAIDAVEFFSESLANQLSKARDKFKDAEDAFDTAKSALSKAKDDASDAAKALDDATGNVASALARKLRLESELQQVKDEVDLPALKDAVSLAGKQVAKQQDVMAALLGSLVDLGVIEDGELPTGTTLSEAIATAQLLEQSLAQVLSEIGGLSDARDLLLDQIDAAGIDVTSLETQLQAATELLDGVLQSLWDAGFPADVIPTPDDLLKALTEEAEALDLLNLAQEAVGLAQSAYDEVSARLQGLLDGFGFDVSISADVEKLSLRWAVGLQVDFGMGYGAPVAVSARYDPGLDIAEIEVFAGPGYFLEIFGSAIYDVDFTFKASLDLFLEVNGDVKIDTDGALATDIDVGTEGLIELLGFRREEREAAGELTSPYGPPDAFVFVFELEDGSEVAISETQPLLLDNASTFDVDKNGSVDMRLLDTKDGFLATLIPDPVFTFDLV